MAQQTKRNPRPSTARTNGSGTSARRRSSASNRSSRSASSRSPSSKPSPSGGNGLTDLARKAKTPALATGAGLAGLAGGLALAHRTTRKRILGVPMPNGGPAQAVSKNLAEAAKNVGSFGEGMGSLAAEVRRVREGLAMAGEQPKRSPIEVVLQGLTRRR